MVIESFRPGVVDRLGIGFEDVREREPRHRLLLDQRLRPGRARLAVGRARHQLPRPSAATCTAASRRADGGPPIPGCHGRGQRGRRHARGHRDPGGIAAPRPHRRGRVPRRLGRRGRALADVAHDRPAPRDRRDSRARPRRADRALRLLRHLPGADDKWLAVGAIEPHFYANLCKALGLEQWIEHQTRRRGAGPDPRGLPRRVSAPATATPGSRSSRRTTPASRRSTAIPELVERPALRCTRRLRRGACTPRHGSFRQLAPVLAGMTAA